MFVFILKYSASQLVSGPRAPSKCKDIFAIIPHISCMTIFLCTLVKIAVLAIDNPLTKILRIIREDFTEVIGKDYENSVVTKQAIEKHVEGPLRLGRLYLNEHCRSLLQQNYLF